MIGRLARLRVPLGFACALTSLFLARPTWPSWTIGVVLVVPGELLRLWAAGHIDKGQEITSSGPYRYVRHPLYTGSALMGAGFAVASRQLGVVLLTAAYLAVMYVAAIRSEEALLDTQFSGAYDAYRRGQVQAVAKPYSWRRMLRNREHHTLAGLAAVFGWLGFLASR